MVYDCEFWACGGAIRFPSIRIGIDTLFCKRMDEDQYYKAIETAWDKSNGDWDRHSECLEAELAEWSVQELVSFRLIGEARRRAAFTPAIYNAAYLLWDGCLGSDGFLDFTDALSVTPRAIYESAITDPDSMRDVAPFRDPSGCFFWIIPYAIFDAQSNAEKGSHLLDDHLPPDEVDIDELWAPVRDCLSLDNALKYVPKTFEKYGDTSMYDD